MHCHRIAIIRRFSQGVRRTFYFNFDHLSIKLMVFTFDGSHIDKFIVEQSINYTDKIKRFLISKLYFVLFYT